MAGDARRALGALGERLAARHLERAGYRILDRNFRTRAGELDLVVAGQACVVFCEVRARIGGRGQSALEPGGPLESIGPQKRRRLRRMAGEWLRARAQDGSGFAPAAGRLRFDAIGVTIDGNGALLRLEHVEDAF